MAKRKRSSNTNYTKYWGEHMCCGRVFSSCSNV